MAGKVQKTVRTNQNSASSIQYTPHKAQKRQKIHPLKQGDLLWGMIVADQPAASAFSILQHFNQGFTEFVRPVTFQHQSMSVILVVQSK